MTGADLLSARVAGASVRALPSRYAGARFGPLAEGSPVLGQIVKDYLKDFWKQAMQGSAPAFVGTTESYKTYASAVLAKAIAGANLPVEWLACGVILTGMSPWQAREAHQFGNWFSCPFLVLDDITTLKPGSPAIDVLQAIVLARFDNQLPTCWTANLPGARLDTALAEHFGVSVARRLLEGSTGFRGLV